jgi:F-type H+-transporting ATPase subunit delta
MSRAESYAQALIAIGNAEGDASVIETDLHAFANAVAGSPELQNSLSDSSMPAANRQQVVEDVLVGKAGKASIAGISMIIGAGRAGDIPDIARELSSMLAGNRGSAYAEVRSAVALTDDQIQRLEAALSKKAGRPVSARVTIDPTVVGGLVTQIDDTVIDGSVRRRLSQMRETLA